jgi:hypothetical protein
MLTTPASQLKSEVAEPPLAAGKTGGAQGLIAWSSFFFALLQSVCTFFAAVDGLRLLIGAGSLAFAIEAGKVLDRFHVNWIRIPMVVFALLGSLLNLAILAQLRYLRNRPASQWRQQPLSRQKLRMERMQLFLALATLILLGIEECLHFKDFHRF